MEKKYTFKVDDLQTQLPELIQNGVTELFIYDEKVSKDKKSVLRIINFIAQNAPDLFVSILVSASVIDREVASAATQIYCSFDIPLVCQVKGEKLLFDKKFYAGKAALLNDFGLVFGFNLDYAADNGDSLKSFLERLDFAVQQYPNHIQFNQLDDSFGKEPEVTGFFSAKDIRYARDVAFACSVFYSCGRAVPWFLSVLKPLRIYPSSFFSDFAEWQHCNNCDYKSGFNPEKENHSDIEKMQLLFVSEKYEEKKQNDLILAVSDIIKINGAMSRLVGENTESVLEVSYHPDDLLGPESMNISSFVENVCMENCKVKIFASDEGPDYSIL